MKKEQVTATLMALLVLGGCSTIQLVPKFFWSSNVLRKAEGMNWTCVGTMRVGELMNPVTWFWTPPISHYFVQQDSAKLTPRSSTEWLVQKVVINYDEEQMTYYSLYDTASNKSAYVGGNATPKEELQSKMRVPEWEKPKTEWSRNTLKWLKSGKPHNTNYCT